MAATLLAACSVVGNVYESQEAASVEWYSTRDHGARLDVRLALSRDGSFVEGRAETWLVVSLLESVDPASVTATAIEIGCELSEGANREVAPDELETALSAGDRELVVRVDPPITSPARCVVSLDGLRDRRGTRLAPDERELRFRRGDIDGDGVTNDTDGGILMDIILSDAAGDPLPITLTREQIMADLNADGFIDNLDIGVWTEISGDGP